MSLLERTLLHESDRETEKLKKAQRGIPDTRNEKQISGACVKVLKQLGFRVWNLSQARASKQTPGLADCFVAGHGVTCWIEYKTPLGAQTLAQREFGRAVDTNHGHYLLARSEADVIAWSRTVIKGAT